MLRAALSCLLLSAAPALAEGQIEIEDPYAISAVPGLPSGAAYMVIRNHGSAPDRLLSVASPAAESVELHGNEEEEGVMRMRPLEEPLEIPAGAEVPLERGGLHVMFMGLAAPFEDGALVALTLTFEEAGAIEVEVPVDLDRLTGATGAEHDHEGHGDHGGHGG